MSQIDQTGEEIMNSLTGFDEIAIAQSFGTTVARLAEHDPMMMGRALVFVTKRREGLSDEAARNEAMALTLQTLTTGYFATEVTEAGKAESPEPEQQPLISQSSAS